MRPVAKGVDLRFVVLRRRDDAQRLWKCGSFDREGVIAPDLKW